MHLTITQPSIHPSTSLHIHPSYYTEVSIHPSYSHRGIHPSIHFTQRYPSIHQFSSHIGSSRLTFAQSHQDVFLWLLPAVIQVRPLLSHMYRPVLDDVEVLACVR